MIDNDWTMAEARSSVQQIPSKALSHQPSPLGWPAPPKNHWCFSVNYDKNHSNSID
jgi:hypothetical protein